MNFLQNLRISGGGGGGGAADEQTAPAEMLSPEELRQRRLQHLERTATGAATTTTPATPVPTPPTTMPTTTPPVAAPPPSLSRPIQVPGKTPTSEPTKKKERPTGDTINDALVFLLRVSLAPATPDVHYLAQSAVEHAQTVLTQDNVAAVLFSRISAEPNDLAPRPTESPVRYLFGCIERVPDALRRFKTAEEAIKSTSALLVSYLTTCLAEPGISPQSALARTSAGPAPSVHHELLDLLRQERTRAKAVLVLEQVATESAAMGVAAQIVPVLLDILSKRARDAPLDLCEDQLAQLCRLKPWAAEIAGVLASETAAQWDAEADADPLAFLRLHARKRKGARFEAETKLGPFLTAISSSTPSFMASSFAPGADARARRDVIHSTRLQLQARRAVLGDAFLSLCKASAQTREQTMAWLALALELNADRSKSQPAPGTVASHGFAHSLASVLLVLCWPFVEKTDAKQMQTLVQETTAYMAHAKAYAGEAKLGPEAAPALAKPKFVSQAFALALRAMALGPISALDVCKNVRQQMGYLNSHDEGDSEQYQQLEALLLAMVCETLEADFFAKGLALYALASKWVMGLQLGLDDKEPAWWQRPDVPAHLVASPAVQSVPQHVFSDVSKYAAAPLWLDPSVADNASLVHWEAVLNFFIVTMNSPAFAPNTHVRAEMGDAVFDCFLPDAAKYDDALTSSMRPRESLIGVSPLACTRLVPVLMQLYGDVEATSMYERFDHRVRITRVLRYLWSLDSHRPSFRTFAQTATQNESDEQSDFVKFAHGILNQTNSFVADSMSKLREIRRIQLEKRNAETWDALPQNERELREQMLAEDEKHVASSLKVSNEVLAMLKYLMTDDAFVRAFSVRGIRGRLVDLFASVVDALAGAKGREFKIDNPEKYNFNPKDMLANIVQTLLCFAASQDVAEALGLSGYYNETVFTKAGQLVLQWGMITSAQAEAYFRFNERCGQAQENAKRMERDLGDAPDEFLDPITSEVMVDPVMLPTSKNVVDREVIVRHLLNEKNDPFNRAPLDASMLVPQPELKARIEKWKRGEGAG